MKHTKILSMKSIILIVVTIGMIVSTFKYYDLRLIETVSATPLPQAPAIEGTIYAVTASNKLISFNRTAPNAIITSLQITDVQAGDQIVAIDFRPRTGQLFGISNNNRIYTINPATGAALGAAATPLDPALMGTVFGFDFNPTVDRIRVVSDADQDLRLNPNNGTVAAVDGTLAYAAGDPNVGANPNVVGSAYTNNFSGSTTTTLYGIDSGTDALVSQGSIGSAPVSPNTGQLFTIGSLGVDTSDQVGFDITNPGGLALASLTPQGSLTSSLYTINLISGAATPIGTIGGGEIIRDIASVIRVETIYALTAGNNLLSFNSGTPGTIAGTLPISGLGSGEILLGIDFRPATGQLFATSNQSRVFTINPTTGAATQVGAAPFTPSLNGASFGFDFNPVPDRIRVVSDAGQNLRLNPNNGALAGVDGNLAFATGDANATATPAVVGAAYTNNVAGTATTSLYVIDSNLDALLLQGSAGGSPVSPNTGQLTTVGALGINTGDQVGFDIAPFTNAAFASLTPAGTATSSLYTLNLNSGAATLIGTIAGGEAIRDIAIAPVVEIIYAATNSNKLITFNSQAPGAIQSTVQITGFIGDETVIGIDFRPATGQLFMIGSSSRIYIVDPLSGVATQAGTGITTPQLNGIAYGFDFNPVPDRIRVVSTATHNLRFVPDSGASAGIDAPLAYAANDIRTGQPTTAVGAAYNNNFAGSTSTTLFVIDSNFDTLLTQGSPGGSPISPNSGQLFTIGSLGVDTNEMVGFDIADFTNNAYASLTVGGVSQLYTINLLNGAAAPIGNIGGGEVIRGIAIVNKPPTPPPPPLPPATLAVVNAASFANDSVAPDSLAAAFGNFQTMDGKLHTASSQPMPTTLGGVKLKVNGADAQLLAVSNGQINFLMPSFDSDGPANVVVTNANGATTTGTLSMSRASTGIFSARSNGQGAAAAVWTNDGVNYQSVFNSDGTEREMSPGTPGKPTFLVLFVTGLRNAPASNPKDANGMAEAVAAVIHTENAPVVFAGPSPGFSGMDQVNIVIPPSLAGAGVVNVTLVVGGRTSNVVTIKIGK